MLTSSGFDLLVSIHDAYFLISPIKRLAMSSSLETGIHCRCALYGLMVLMGSHLDVARSKDSGMKMPPIVRDVSLGDFDRFDLDLLVMFWLPMHSLYMS